MNFKTALLEGNFVPKVNEVLKKEKIDNLDTLRNVISPIIQQHPDVEKFYTLYLNAKNGLILIDPSFTGSISGCSVYPREIIKKGLEVGAVAMIFAHNHPSGEIAPSSNDFDITQKLVDAASMIGMTVHDHLVCSPTDYYSMQENGHIAMMKTRYNEYANSTTE